MKSTLCSCILFAIGTSALDDALDAIKSKLRGASNKALSCRPLGAQCAAGVRSYCCSNYCRVDSSGKFAYCVSEEAAMALDELALQSYDKSIDISTQGLIERLEDDASMENTILAESNNSDNNEYQDFVDEKKDIIDTSTENFDERPRCLDDSRICTNNLNCCSGRCEGFQTNPFRGRCQSRQKDAHTEHQPLEIAFEDFVDVDAKKDIHTSTEKFYDRGYPCLDDGRTCINNGNCCSGTCEGFQINPFRGRCQSHQTDAEVTFQDFVEETATCGKQGDGCRNRSQCCSNVCFRTPSGGTCL